MKYLFLLFLLPGCSKLDTEKKRVSYLVGQQIGANLQKSPLDLDADLVADGLRDGLRGKSALSAAEQAEAAQAIAKQANEKAKAEGARQATLGAKFLAQNRERDSVKETASGLQYEVLREGKGAAPHAESTVTVRYEGHLVDGRLFDSTAARGGAVKVKVKNLTPGMRQGILLMRPGAKYRIVLPANLAFGHEERPGIPPESVLVYDVELFSVEN